MGKPKNQKPASAKQPEKENDTQAYCDSLNAIRNGIENKHTYFVEVNTGTAGVVDQINVYYDKDKAPAGGESTT